MKDNTERYMAKLNWHNFVPAGVDDQPYSKKLKNRLVLKSPRGSRGNRLLQVENFQLPLYGAAVASDGRTRRYRGLLKLGSSPGVRTIMCPIGRTKEVVVCERMRDKAFCYSQNTTSRANMSNIAMPAEDFLIPSESSAGSALTN